MIWETGKHASVTSVVSRTRDLRRGSVRKVVGGFSWSGHLKKKKRAWASYEYVTEGRRFYAWYWLSPHPVGAASSCCSCRDDAMPGHVQDPPNCRRMLANFLLIFEQALAMKAGHIYFIFKWKNFYINIFILWDIQFFSSFITWANVHCVFVIFPAFSIWIIKRLTFIFFACVVGVWFQREFIIHIGFCRNKVLSGSTPKRSLATQIKSNILNISSR